MDARVVRVCHVCRDAPSAKAAQVNARLGASARHIVHPDRSDAFTIRCAALGSDGVREAQLHAHDTSVLNAPPIVIDGSPLALMEDLDATLGGPFSEPPAASLS